MSAETTNEDVYFIDKVKLAVLDEDGNQVTYDELKKMLRDELDITKAEEETKKKSKGKKDKKKNNDDELSDFEKGIAGAIALLFSAVIFYGMYMWIQKMESVAASSPKVVFHAPNSTDTFNCLLFNMNPVEDDLTEMKFYFEYDRPHATLENWNDEYTFKFRHFSYLPNDLGYTVDNFSNWNKSTRVKDTYKRRMHLRDAFNMEKFEVGMQIITSAPIKEKDTIFTVKYNLNCDKTIQAKWNHFAKIMKSRQ